ncbi:MAG: hypothetical protein IAE97_00200 [Chthoniobacterales bacterium]|nr:hypothetical protein [Chthoniobacterales bacterium]
MTSINAAIDAAYAAALVSPGNASELVSEGVSIRTETYVSPAGTGFRVVCSVAVPAANFVAVKVRNHGPDTASERDWPAEGVEAAAQAHVLRCVDAGKAHVRRAGFDGLEMASLLRRFMEAQQANELANKPKLVALYGWTATVEQQALAGHSIFPPAPHTFEEVMAE